MVQLWKHWCRLCAREDSYNTHINVYLNNVKDLELYDNINNMFSVEVSDSNNFPTMICTSCYHLIKTTIKLNERIPKVTAMFLELHLRNEEGVDLKKIKTLHNLDSDFKILVSENHTELKPKDEVQDTTEQMIEQEFMDCKTLEPNPINIKTEEDEENARDGLISHSDENSDESDSADTKETNKLKIKRKYKSKKERWAENQKKPYSCSECQKGFMKLYNYRRHMQGSHDIAIEFKAPVFICENCGKEYKTLSALKEHERSHTEERNLKCKYCEKKFKGLPTLKLHEDTHNDTNYICVVCGLQLNTQQTLRMHMVVHSDQKRHKCDFCGNEYKRAKALKNHLILHTGLRPYSCDFCEKTFASGANCRSHKKKYHPVALAAQEAAGKNFNSKAVIPKLKDLKAVMANKINKVRDNDLKNIQPISSVGSKSFRSLESRQNDLQKSVDTKSSKNDKSSSKEEPDFFQKIFGPIALS